MMFYLMYLWFSSTRKPYTFVDENHNHKKQQRIKEEKNKEQQRIEQERQELEQKQISFEQDRRYYIQDKKRYQQYLKRENKKQSAEVVPVKLSETDLIRAFTYRRTENFRLAARKNYTIEEGSEYIRLLDRKGNSYGTRFITHYRLNGYLLSPRRHRDKERFYCD